MMNLHPLSLWSFLIALVCLVGIIVLSAINHTVPTELDTALFISLGSGAGSGLVAPSKTS